MAIGTMLAASAASSLISSGVGIAANEIFNEKPDVPNYSAETYAQYQQQRQDLEESFQDQADELEATLAASGRSGSAGVSAREELYDSTNDALVDLAAKEADAVRRAENRERAMRYKGNMREYQNRAQGIADMQKGVGALSTNLIANEFGKSEAQVTGETQAAGAEQTQSAAQILSGGDNITPGQVEETFASSSEDFASIPNYQN